MTRYQYHFETHWEFESDIEQIWELINGSDHGDWWHGLDAKRIKKGDRMNGVGDRFITTFHTKLPYQLSFESEVIKKERPLYIEIKASGELEGIGVWTLAQVGSITHVQYTWEVNTTKKWMNFFGPLLRPGFVWNHKQVMDEGAKGIANRLGVSFVAT
ncbi:MAG: hypothetical protein R3267_10605 [Paenisporosarcina sp.]|nr:hypothetical protein [Paenisporosarcina sp.]